MSRKPFERPSISKPRVSESESGSGRKRNRELERRSCRGLPDLEETLRGREVSELLRLAEFMLLPEVLWGEGWGYGRRKTEAIRNFAK